MIKRSWIGTLMAVLFIAGCNNAGNVPSSNTIDTVGTNTQMPVPAIDSLEKMFDNANWMWERPADTSYFYFSRLERNSIKVTRYHIFKGDSAQSTVNYISAKTDTTFWPFDGKNYMLASVSSEAAIWVGADGNGSLVCRTSGQKILEIRVEGQAPMTLTRTLPLATFLVRSRYDYVHGTRLAFSH